MIKKILLLLSVLTLSSSIVAHADSSLSMTSPSDPAHLTHQIRNFGAFALILDDGTLKCWGNDACWGNDLWGGSTPTIPAGRKVVSIASADGAFAAILDNGTLQCWGDSWRGGSTPTLPKNRSILFITGMQD